MRSKLKIFAMMWATGVVAITSSCEKDKHVALPPAESEVGKAETAKAMAEREAKEKAEQEELKKKMEQEKLRAKLQEAVQNLDSYTKEGLEKDTEMDPFIKDTLLMAMEQKDARKKQKEQEQAKLMELEKAAGSLLDAIDKEKQDLAAANAEMLAIAEQQKLREESERKEKNTTAPEGMVWVPGGKFLRGSSDLSAKHRQQYGEEFPAHIVEVDGFYMDATEVTNAQFTEFVKATGYKTLAEVGLKQEDFPNASPQDLQGGANVFRKTEGKIDPWMGSPWRWWSFTPGASWKSPEGPGSDIKDKMDHPVACLNYDDAAAYAKWAGKRLPTEAEWERAARAGMQGQTYIWGEELQVDGKWMANVYQGEFPSSLEAEDGYTLTAPVKSYPANAWGLYDMAGNVWEMCSDYFHPGYYHTFLKQPHKNPKGPAKPITDAERAAYNPVAGTCPEPRGDSHPLAYLRVAKGGSFLCSTQYCLRFRPAARHQHEAMTPSQHTGFRCVKDIK